MSASGNAKDLIINTNISKYCKRGVKTTFGDCWWKRASGILLYKHGINEIIIGWIKTMLEDRQIQAGLGKESLTVQADRGCPQWNLVVYNLLKTLIDEGFYTHGYADDIVMLIRSRHSAIIAFLMQRDIFFTVLP